jgi:hypothetical protein
MINFLKYITEKLQQFKCWRHYKWNSLLEYLKVNCNCDAKNK